MICPMHIQAVGYLAWTPGPTEIIIVLLLVLLLFGGKKLPELARGLGKGLRSFKKELQGLGDDDEEPADTEPTKPTPRKLDESEKPEQNDTPESKD